jgi:hypothetical protein
VEEALVYREEVIALLSLARIEASLGGEDEEEADES